MRKSWGGNERKKKEEPNCSADASTQLSVSFSFFLIFFFPFSCHGQVYSSWGTNQYTRLRDHCSLFPPSPKADGDQPHSVLPDSRCWVSYITVSVVPPSFPSSSRTALSCVWLQTMTKQPRPTTALTRRPQATARRETTTSQHTIVKDIDSLCYMDISWIIRDSDSLLILLIIFSDMSRELLVHKKTKKSKQIKKMEKKEKFIQY